MFAHWIQDFFPTLESGFKHIWICYGIRWMCVDRSHIGKKKLWFQKYLDACKQGLNYYW